MRTVKEIVDDCKFSLQQIFNTYGQEPLSHSLIKVSFTQMRTELKENGYLDEEENAK
ncbi:unnamed protein product [marine sediment metagenome]|uniref:Uncharacterized protein n=1 Tax=marine sediment metagenome TaxID=412755 RepID=X0Y4N4_9ZZZZ